MPRCEIIMEVTVVEKFTVNTPWFNWTEAIKKAEEKMKKKYKWKEVTIGRSNRKYESFI